MNPDTVARTDARSYAERGGVPSDEAAWRQARQAYGLRDDQRDAYLRALAYWFYAHPEDEEMAVEREYGHLDFDRGVFDALAPAAPLSGGAKVGIGVGVAGALGVLAWWLWPAAPVPAAGRG